MNFFENMQLETSYFFPLHHGSFPFPITFQGYDDIPKEIPDPDAKKVLNLAI